MKWHCTPMKKVEDEFKTTGQGGSADGESAGGSESKKEGDKVGGDKAGVVGVAEAGGYRGSVSLHGEGDHSGRDKANSMSLAEAYARTVLPRAAEESQLGREDVGKVKVCVSCGTTDPGTRLGHWAYTQQLKPICQKCATGRA